MQTKRRIIFSVALALLVSLMLAGVVLAAPGSQTDADARMARVAAKGYLSSLKRSPATQAGLVKFYLSDAAMNSTTAQALSGEQIKQFTLSGETWLDDNTFRVTAQLDDNPQVLLLDTQKIDNRWKVVELTWADGVTLQTATGGAVPVDDGSGSTTYGQVTIMSPALNLRNGPGTYYGIADVLYAGDKADITAQSGNGNWYQIARDGETLGWVSSAPSLVSAKNVVDDLPVASAPQPTAGSGKMVLQPQTGGEFYLVNANFAPFANGEVVQRLTTGVDPDFSPDGSKIAFTRWDAAGEGNVWIYDLTTGQEYPLDTASTFKPSSPSWSPDGQFVVVSIQNGGRLEVKRVCQSAQKSIPEGAYDFSYNSRGQVCFKLPVDLHWQLREINVADGSYRDLAADRYAQAPTWDPAQPWRIVATGRSGLTQTDRDRNEYFAFSQDLRDRGPVFSPNGGHVALSYRQHQSWDIHIINTTSAERTRLTKPDPLGDNYSSAAPAYSPDGQQIAFVTNRNGDWEFYVMMADGSGQRPLLPPSIAAEFDVEYRGLDERLISWAP